MFDPYPVEDYKVDERNVISSRRRRKDKPTLYQWLVGAMFTLIMALGGWGLMNVATVQSRLAAAEARIENTHEDVDKIGQRLDKIDDKLDRIIDQNSQIRGALRPRRSESPFDGQ